MLAVRVEPAQPSASASWVRFQCEEARWTGQGLLLWGGQRFCGNTDEGSLFDRVAGWGVKPGHCSAASGSRAHTPNAAAAIQALEWGRPLQIKNKNPHG